MLGKIVKVISVNLAVLCGLVLLALFVAESYLRVLPLEARVPAGRDSAEFYLNKLIHDDVLRANYFGETCRVRYRDYYYYSVVCQSERLNTTPYFDARATPDSSQDAHAPIVWMFGGSTLLNRTAPDELTIANQIAVYAKQHGVPLRVRNFGMGGFASSSEVIKYVDLLRRVPADERPAVVVLYDGYNDAAQSATFGAGNLQEDLNGKIRSTIENQRELFPSVVSDWLSGYSLAWRRWMAPIIQRRYSEKLVQHRAPVSSDPAEAVELYLNNTRIAKAIAREMGAKPLFVLQPMIFTKQPLTEMEQDVLKYVVEPNLPHLTYMKQWYALVLQRVQGQADYFDATAVMNGRTTDDYIDHGHMGPDSGVAVAAPMAQRILALIQNH